MTSPLTHYKIPLESLPYRLRGPTATLPETNRVILLQKRHCCYQELRRILTTKPFKNFEATSLLARVESLRLSIAVSMEAFETNRFSRALDLAGDPVKASFNVFLRNRNPESDLHFICQSNRSNLEKAFSYLSTPLTTIIKTAPTLFSDDTSFSLPRKTSVFFMSQFLGETPRQLKTTIFQGAFSCVTAHNLNRDQLVLKATERSLSDAPGELSRIETQERQMRTEACVYMASANNPTILALEAYSEKRLWLEKQKQDFFTFTNEAPADHPNFSPKKLTLFFSQIGTALGNLHDIGIVHEDFKPENILFTEEGNLKLCDFGAAARNGSRKHYLEMTPFYASPSKFYLSEHDETSDKDYPMLTSSDCWSFGIWMYECISGFLPFYDKKSTDVLADQIIISIQNRISHPDTTSGPPSTNIEFVVNRLIIDWNISSIESFNNPLIRRSIEDAALSLNIRGLLRKYLAAIHQGNTPEILFANLDQESKHTVKRRDPLDFFKSIIIRCLNPNDATRITMREILTILQNPPRGYH